MDDSVTPQVHRQFLANRFSAQQLAYAYEQAFPVVRQELPAAPGRSDAPNPAKARTLRPPKAAGAGA